MAYDVDLLTLPMPVLSTRCRNGIQQNANAERTIARIGTLRPFVLPKYANTRKYHGWPGPPSKRLVSANRLLEATYRFVLAQVSAVNIKKALIQFANGALMSFAMATKADCVVFVPVISGLSLSCVQLSRGSCESFHWMLKDAKRPPIV